MVIGKSARDSGFTMIELLIVVSLIVILTTMGMTQYRHSVIYAREGVLKEDLFRLRDAIDQYYADKGTYPSTLDALISEGYLRKLPDDPFTKSSSTCTAANAVAVNDTIDLVYSSNATAVATDIAVEWQPGGL